ncbi:MAG: thiamine-phosphate kinase [Acidobacteriota bacterium]
MSPGSGDDDRRPSSHDPPATSPEPPASSPKAVASDLSEAELIARISERLPASPPWLTVGIGDDAAVVEPERNRLEVLSVDALVDGIHFDRTFTPPAAIGHRALAVNLSDLAAMGATPRLALLSMALPGSLPIDDFDGIVDSLVALAARFRLTIVGGNLTRIAGPLVIDITVVGTVKRRQVLTRSGARPGDDLYVSGSVGSATAGLAMLRAWTNRAAAGDTGGAEGNGAPPGDREQADLWSARPVPPEMEQCIQRYLYPEPRLRLGTLLGHNRAATACMDLSDGLAEAVRQLADQSGVGAAIDADVVPIDQAARGWFERCGTDPIVEAITGGDDYELVFAVRPRLRGRFRAVARHGAVPLTRIGSCTADRALVLRRDGKDLPLPRGFTHFR